MTQQLEEQNKLLENILKYSSNGISVGEMIRNDKGDIVDIRTIIANEAALAYTGIPRELYLQKTGMELDPNFRDSHYFKQCVECMETGKPFLTQYHLQMVNRWLEVSVSKMDAERQIYIFTDVTSAKEAQIALERSAEKLQSVIDTSQAGFALAEPVYENGELEDFRFTLTNEVLSAFAGKRPEDLMGEVGSMWFKNYKHNGLFDKFKYTYLTGKRQQFDFHYVSANDDVWVNIMTSRVKDELLCSITDFTPIKRLQLQLEKIVDELRRSNESLEEFAYAASHDLQEPLRKIQVFSERLRQNLANNSAEENSAVLSRLESAAVRMRRLIEDLLAYSQVSLKAVSLEEIDLTRVIMSVLQDLYASVNESKAVVQIDVLPKVKGEERQLQQLFQNIIGNALKYRKPDVTPRITIRSKLVQESELNGEPEFADLPKGNYHLIEIKDNGIGFDPEHSRKIFQVFQRLHGRSEYPGTGVGLAIVQKIISNHNGYISARGVPDEGATFSVVLPA